MTPRILIVDDDQDHAESISDILSLRNYQVEIEALLADSKWRTAKEIANKREHPDKPGIGAGVETVRGIL